MAMVEGLSSEHDAAKTFERLALRARLTAISASVLIVVFFLALMMALLPAMDMWALGFFALASFMGILYVGVNPWMAATDFLRGAHVVAQLPNLTVVKARGFMFPRAVLGWGDEGASGAGAVLRFAGGIADEFGGSKPQFRLELPWATPGDVMATRVRTYVDFPELMDLTEEVRRALVAGEYLWSNVPRSRLESTVVPDWGHYFRSNEPPDSVAKRLRSRRQGMDAINIRATGRMRFGPKLLHHGGRGFPGPFALGAWCPRCRRARLPRNAQDGSRCWRCGQPTVQVLSRMNESLRKKIERIEAAGISVGA